MGRRRTRSVPGIKTLLLLVTIFVVPKTSFNAEAADHVSLGTAVGGIIRENTTWTVANSPYTVGDTVQIPDNVTLIIDPGTTVVSSISKDMFMVQGNLLAIGEINNPIIINGTDNFFYAIGSSSKMAVVILKYCEITGGGTEGSLFPSNGYGLLNMSRCKIANVPEPCSPNVCYIEFSIFRDWCSFVVGASFSEATYLCFFNNVFIGRSYFAADEYYTLKCIGLHVIAHYNSFFANDQVIQAYPDATAIEVNATLNYWGTTNTSVIDSMIYDKNDDIRCAGFIEYLPFLTEPHPNTPTLPPLAANAGQNQTVNVGATVTFDASVSSDGVGPISYEWNFGDGATGAGKTTTHVYTSPETYTVTLMVRDAVGNTATDTVTVTVRSPEAPPPPAEAFPMWIASAIVAIVGIAAGAALFLRKRK